MLKTYGRISSGFLVILALSGFAPQRSGLVFVPMENADWAHVAFGGPAAQQLYGFLEMQSEITCDVDPKGWATCRAWINRDGDLVNAAPPEAGRTLWKQVVQGSIQGESDVPTGDGILFFNAENAGLAHFLATPAGHDLNCVNAVCRFSVDPHGAIDPQ